MGISTFLLYFLLSFVISIFFCKLKKKLQYFIKIERKISRYSKNAFCSCWRIKTSMPFQMKLKIELKQFFTKQEYNKGIKSINNHIILKILITTFSKWAFSSYLIFYNFFFSFLSFFDWALKTYSIVNNEIQITVKHLWASSLLLNWSDGECPFKFNL